MNTLVSSFMGNHSSHSAGFIASGASPLRIRHWVGKAHIGDVGGLGFQLWSH